MARVYIEALPKGASEGSDIIGYVVEDGDGVELFSSKRRKDTIDWARVNRHAPQAPVVRHRNDKKQFSHWRPV